MRFDKIKKDINHFVKNHASKSDLMFLTHLQMRNPTNNDGNFQFFPKICWKKKDLIP